MFSSVKTMNYSSYSKLIEPFQEQLTGVYSTATLIISVLLILWIINLVIGFTTKIYSFGKNIGLFYRNFIHRYIRIFFYSLFNLFSIRINNKKYD